MNTTSVGREAEGYVASYLANKGYHLLDQNWRTRYCEIDLIMSQKETVYFIEVKYRTSSVYGSGLEYITPKKLKQMIFAAESWVSTHSWKGDAQLLAVEVTHKLGKYIIVDVLELKDY